MHDPILPTRSRLQSRSLDNGNIGGADVNQVASSYAAPGPFAEWRVTGSFEQANVDLLGLLDFSQVTDAYFDFFGTDYAHWTSGRGSGEGGIPTAVRAPAPITLPPLSPTPNFRTRLSWSNNKLSRILL